MSAHGDIRLCHSLVWFYPFNRYFFALRVLYPGRTTLGHDAVDRVDPGGIFLGFDDPVSGRIHCRLAGHFPLVMLEGILARAIQHEIDHLNGVLFIDRADKNDSDTQNIIKKWRLLEITPNLIMQPAWGFIEPSNLAEWVLSCGLPIRLGLQIHKYIWGPDAKGV